MRYALIDLHSGYICWVGNATTPEMACSYADYDIGGRANIYNRIPESDAQTTAGGYEVHEAPADYDCQDGQDTVDLDRVNRMPLAGYFRRAGHDD